MQKFQQLLGHFLCTERSTTLGCEAAPGRSWTSEKDAGWLLLVLGSHEIHVSYRLYKFHGWWELTCDLCCPFSKWEHLEAIASSSYKQTEVDKYPSSLPTCLSRFQFQLCLSSWERPNKAILYGYGGTKPFHQMRMDVPLQFVCPSTQTLAKRSCWPCPSEQPGFY